MRLPQPHDPDGRPCLPTHHPDPSRPHPTCPRPAPPRQRTAAPAGLPSVPDPRAARGRRHPLVAILGLAAAAVLAGARSIATIAEWAPTRPSRSGPRSAPASRLLATAASRPRPPSAGRFRAWTPTCWPAPSAPGRRHRRLAGRPGPGPSLPVAAVPWRWTARRCAAPAQPTAARCTCWPVWTMPAARCWPNARSAAPPRRSLCSSRCWTGSTSPGRSSPPTRSRPARRPPSSWSPACTPTTCSRSRPTSRPCWTVVSACPGTASPSWTAPATAATAASNYAPSKLSGPPAGHGLPAQPGHRRPQPRRAGQPRRRPAPPRPRPTPTPHDPWDYPQVNRARPKNAQSAGCWGIGGGNSVAVDLGGVATVQL
jgi:hypothetical protein